MENHAPEEGTGRTLLLTHGEARLMFLASHVQRAWNSFVWGSIGLGTHLDRSGGKKGYRGWDAECGAPMYQGTAVAHT